MEPHKSQYYLNRGFLILGCISAMIGSFWLFAWLIGWAGDWSAQGADEGKIIMKTNTALCLLISGLAILLTGIGERSGKVRLIASILAIVVFVIGALTLSEHILHVNFGIDQLLATELPGAAGTPSPNRMGLIAATCFTLIGPGLLLMIWNHKLLASHLGALVCIINLVPAVGYIMEISVFYSLPNLTGIAWYTIIALLSIGLALIFSSREKGFLPLVLEDNIGGALLRRLVLGIIIVPVILGVLISKGEQLKIYNEITGSGLLILTTILLLLLISVLTARSLNSLDSKKNMAEQALRESDKKYHDLVKYAPTGIYEVDFRSKKFTSVNDAMCLLTGYSREELLSISPFEILDDEGKTAFRQRIEKWLTGEKPDENVEYRVLSKDGRIIHALLHAKFNVDEYGNPKGATVVAHDITERKKYENEIQSIAKFPSENPNPIIRLDKGGHVLYSNIAATDIMHKWNSVVGSRVPEEINTIVLEVLAEDSTKTFEVECDDKIYSFQAVPITGKDYINLYGMNITKSRMYETALLKSEEKYRMIVELSHEGIVIASPDGHFQFINKRFADMLGYDPEEIIGRYAGDFFYDAEDEHDVQESRKILKEGKTIQKDMKFRRKDGSMLFTLYNAIPLFDSMGNHFGNLAMHTDITKRKKTEEALKKSDEKLRIALDNAKIGMWEWDIITGEVRWDERMERMMGLEPGTFDWTHESFTSYVHEEDLQHINAAVKKALNGEKSYEAVYRTKPKDGKSNYISSKALITRDDKGNPIYVSGVCFDVTDMKEGAERSLIALNEALLRSNNDLQQFAYVASHDLQEPLRMVSSFTQLLQIQYGDKLDERAKEYINFAVDGSKRMYELLNGLLVYSRIQTKGIIFHEVSLDKVLVKVKDNLRLLITEKDAEITSERMPVINADENQMIQLLQNLIENSIKFCNKKPVIHISSESGSDKDTIYIKDNGIGIESAYYDKVFRIFQRLHSQDKYKGTGIGLAISRKIVERHGGEIRVESVPGMGSTFSFTIPKH